MANEMVYLHENHPIGRQPEESDRLPPELFIPAWPPPKVKNRPGGLASRVTFVTGGRRAECPLFTKSFSQPRALGS
jgi:hypothetical protein